MSNPDESKYALRCGHCKVVLSTGLINLLPVRPCPLAANDGNHQHLVCLNCCNSLENNVNAVDA